MTFDPYIFNKRFKGYANGTESPSPSRSSGKTSETGCALLFMVPFILAGIVVAVLAVKAIYAFYLFQTEGEVTEGVVTDKRISTDSSGDDTYHVSYDFQVEGRPYSGSAQVNWDVYNEATQGQPFGVRYAGNHPDINDADENSVYFEPIFFIIFALFWNGFVAVFLYGILGGAGKDSADRPGTVVKGTIDGIRVYQQNNATRVEVTYHFLSPTTGRTIRTRWDGACPDMVGRKKPDPGETIAVNYVDEKRHRPL